MLAAGKSLLTKRPAAASGPEWRATGPYNASVGSVSSLSCTGPGAGTGDVVVVWVIHYAGSDPTFGMTYDSSATGVVHRGKINFFSGGTTMGLSCLTVTAGSDGNKAILVTPSISAEFRVASDAFSGVSTIGSFTTGTGSGSPMSLALSSAGVVSAAFGVYNGFTATSTSGFSGTTTDNHDGSMGGGFTISHRVGHQSAPSSLSCANAGASSWASAGIALT